MGWNYIIIAGATFFFIIGVYETIVFEGIGATYSFFMISGALFLWSRYRIVSARKEDEKRPQNTSSAKPRKKRKR